jgi:hypothetical protein
MGTAPTRKRVLETAEAYATHPWVAGPSNTLHGVDPDGVRVDSPDREFAGDLGWRVGLNVGIPYCWGGFDSIDSFDRAVARGKSAGFIFNDHRSRHPSSSRFAAGVDCSGLVSRCWELPSKYSTGRFAEDAVPLRSWNRLRPGDIINKPVHHVLLFKGFQGRNKERVEVYEAGKWRVKRSVYEVADLAKLGFTPMTDWRPRAKNSRAKSSARMPRAPR